MAPFMREEVKSGAGDEKNEELAEVCGRAVPDQLLERERAGPRDENRPGIIGRGGGIRTPDPLLPKHYQWGNWGQRETAAPRFY